MGWREGTSSTGALYYCFADLKERDIDFFGGLPVSTVIHFDGLAPVLACHGSPERNHEKMLPDHADTKRILEQSPQRYILCGHTHVQRTIGHNGKIAINPGAVGVPLHSGGKAQFVILHSCGKEWEHEFISLEYDRERVIKELYCREAVGECRWNDIPEIYWEKAADELLKA